LIDAYFNSKHAAIVPLIVVFSALLAAYTLQVESSWHQCRQLKLQIVEMEKDLPRAKLVNAKMLEVSRDLIDLSRKSRPAQQIVREFKIQFDPGQGKKEKAS
jgi:hypothetical protein